MWDNIRPQIGVGVPWGRFQKWRTRRRPPKYIKPPEKYPPNFGFSQEICAYPASARAPHVQAPPWAGRETRAAFLWKARMNFGLGLGFRVGGLGIPPRRATKNEVRHSSQLQTHTCNLDRRRTHPTRQGFEGLRTAFEQTLTTHARRIVS